MVKFYSYGKEYGIWQNPNYKHAFPGNEYFQL